MHTGPQFMLELRKALRTIPLLPREKAGMRASVRSIVQLIPALRLVLRAQSRAARIRTG